MAQQYDAVNELGPDQLHNQRGQSPLILLSCVIDCSIAELLCKGHLFFVKDQAHH